ncbi:MAG: hypothetical protein ACI4LI_05630 [Candidatus Fimenecus sp.]
MKKAICMILAGVLCLLSLCACTRRATVSVNGTPIGEGVAAYFIDAARQALPDATEEERTAEAHRQIAEYVAINSAFSERNLALTTAEKAAVSQSVNNLWRLFGAYYTDLGVTKQDLLLVEISKAYKDAVMADYYAPDGDEPVSEETLKAYFNENYVAFKSVTGFLTTADDSGNAVALSDADKQSLTARFEKSAAAINGGSSVEEQASAIENTTANTETVVVHRDNPNYPDGFFEQVAGIENGTAKAFVLGEYIFLIQREDITDADRNLFATYRTDCLRTLKGAAFETVLQNWSTAYTVTD